MEGRKTGFPPVFDGESKILILGSFPSVKSREEGFYYGNPRNRFWGIVCSFFGEEIPKDVEGKRAFLHRRQIALWDMVTSCEIEGSRDESIQQEEIGDVDELLKKAPIKVVFCNGQTAYKLCMSHSKEAAKRAKLLPSTSPRNAGCKGVKESWHDALREFYQKG